jgi:ferric-dicitrate binding protein FerR (iron transport regulator)
VQYFTLYIPRGQDYEFVLPDGTKIWLNAESSLTFPERFPPGERSVKLTGEGYFEVTHDAKRPFRVLSGETILEVLGTVFDISAYPQDEFVATTLIDGSVRQKFTSQGEEYMLTPLQQIKYLKAENRVERRQVDADEIKSRRNGKFVFRDLPLAEIATVLGRVYNYQIVLENEKLKQESYHIIVHKNEEITVILDNLKKTGGFAYEITDRQIRIY